jgi:hypothetical protein
MEMRRFENAKVGDEVYCRLNGNGVITERLDGNGVITERLDGLRTTYPIVVNFDKSSDWYTLDGRCKIEDAEPILFYRKGDEKYLTERPKQKRVIEETMYVNVYREGRNYIYRSREEAVEHCRTDIAIALAIAVPVTVRYEVEE